MKDNPPDGTFQVRMYLALVGELGQLDYIESPEAVRDQDRERELQSHPRIVGVWGIVLGRNRSHSVPARVWASVSRF